MWILHLIIIIAQKNCSLCFSLFIVSPKGSNISCCVHVLLHTREEWQRQNGGDFLFPFEDDKPLRWTDDWVSCCTDNREGGWSPSPSLGGVLVPPQPRISRYERVLVEPPQPSLQEPGRGLWPVILTFLSLYKEVHAITGLVHVPAIMRVSVRCTFTRK